MEYNEIAAKWWADCIRNVGLNNFNNGDESEAGGIAMALGFMAAMRSKQPDHEAIDRFEKILAEEIKKRVKEYGSQYIYVDYGPDRFLSEASQKAGLNFASWPWKTSMFITTQKVQVSQGAGAIAETIFPPCSK